MLVAIMTRIRYFGGGLGFIPRIRRTYRLTIPRGFFSPDSSVSSACSVPGSPLAPFMPPPMKNRLRTPPTGPPVFASACSASRASCQRVSGDR
jgi:hypothetical protein